MIGIGDRFKKYEKAYSAYMPFRLPVIVRVDGKTFHTFTKDMDRPYDEQFVRSMAKLAGHLLENVHTSQIAYVQSDEISLLLHPYKKLDTDPYFGNEIQKISSVIAGMASSYFSLLYGREAVFDARCFVLPEAEVCNYFIWRQQDATRNSISMLAQSKFSHKELHKKNSKVMQEMIFQKDGTNWNDLSTYLKRGFLVKRENGETWMDIDTPIFSNEREAINKYLEVIEE